MEEIDMNINRPRRARDDSSFLGSCSPRCPPTDTMPPTSPTEENHPLISNSPASSFRLASPTSSPSTHPSPQDSLISPIIIPHLYLSHILSTANSRLFEFAAVLFLASSFPSTLLPLSLYALVRGLAAIFLSPALGSLIDTGERLSVVRLSILTQRVAVSVSCVGFWVLWTARDSTTNDILRPGYFRWTGRSLGMENVNYGKLVVFIVVILLACVEKLAATLNTIAVERDWVVELTTGDPAGRARTNGRLRQIDLFCKLLAPLAIAIVDTYDTGIAIIITGSLSLLSVTPEYFLIARVYHLALILHRSPDGSMASNLIPSLLHSARTVVTTTYHSLPMYLHHRALLPSLSLSLLYFTVLSFSGQMIAFLLASGFTSFEVGVARMVSSCFELTATVVAPVLVRWIGPVRAGIWSLCWQTGWLGVGVGWFLAHGEGEVVVGKMVGVCGLVVGVMVSRVGLWGYDLAAQVIIQDEVEEHERGTFSTIEASVQNFFELMAFAATAVFHRPDQFQVPTLISFAAVAGACLLYTRFVKLRRGHLFHAPACLKHREYVLLRTLPQ